MGHCVKSSASGAISPLMTQTIGTIQHESWSRLGCPTGHLQSSQNVAWVPEGERRKYLPSSMWSGILCCGSCSRKVVSVPNSKSHVALIPFRQGMNSIACLEYNSLLHLSKPEVSHISSFQVSIGHFCGLPLPWMALNLWPLTINIQAAVDKLNDLELISYETWFVKNHKPDYYFATPNG